MEQLKFNTNIKCEACVAKVTNTLNGIAGEENWEVNLAAPERTLTITTNAAPQTIVDALKILGYEAESV